MKQFDTLLKCECNLNYGLTYQKCRFCPASWPEVDHLWKYAVRHYICDACLIKSLDERRMSSWSQREEDVYSEITGQHSLTDIKGRTVAQ